MAQEVKDITSMVISMRDFLWVAVTFGAVFLTVKRQNRRNGNSNSNGNHSKDPPFTRKIHDDVCKGNLGVLENSLKTHFSNSIGRVHERLDTLIEKL